VEHVALSAGLPVSNVAVDKKESSWRMDHHCIVGVLNHLNDPIANFSFWDRKSVAQSNDPELGVLCSGLATTSGVRAGKVGRHISALTLIEVYRAYRFRANSVDELPSSPNGYGVVSQNCRLVQKPIRAIGGVR
jgi:hypothetical protein